MNYYLSGRWWVHFVALAFSLAYPSIAIFKKVGSLPLLLYALGSTALLFIALARLIPFLSSRFGRRASWFVGLAVLAILSAAYFVIHPMIDTAGFRLLGIKFGASDADNAIDVALSALLAGHYPYYATTFLNNPLTPMPGALLFALPFYLAGNSAFQNVVWLGVFWALVSLSHGTRTSTLLLLLALLLSPNVTYHALQGTDYISNSIYVLASVLLTMTSLAGTDRTKALAACLLGISLASRPNWFLVVPVVFLYLARHSTFSMAVKMMAVTCMASALTILPFYLYDPQHFSPLQVGSKLTIGNAFPHAHIVFFVAGCCLAALLGVWRGNSSVVSQIGSCFIVQAAVAVGGCILASLAAGRMNLEYPHYGVLFMFFGIFAYGPALVHDALTRRDPSPEPSL